MCASRRASTRWSIRSTATRSGAERHRREWTVAILFTRAVNELTPANSGSYVGGFFHPRDLFPRTQSPTRDVCATSNEGELFYMIVPDPTGVVNGNRFRLGMVDTLTTGVLAHEFSI